MKKNIPKLIFQVSLLLSIIILVTCVKLEKAMLVSTGEITNVLTNTAEASGLIIDLGDGATQHGHCYGTAPNVTTAGSKTELGHPAGTGGFTSQLSNLTAGTKYYIKAYITNGTETAYGSETNFTTVSASVPTLTTQGITSITTTSASSGGNISNEGGAPVTARGVCWNTSTSPTIANNKTTDGTGTGGFVSNLTGLTGNTTYYIRAYATNSAGTGYGDEIVFKTGAVIPILTTKTVTSVTANSASSGGVITTDGGASVLVRGLCYGVTTNPTIANSVTSDLSGALNFTSTITGLAPNTTYYVRAYATNSVGTGYGNELSFTTSAIVVIVPTLTTSAIGSVTSTSAASGGSITSDGGASIISVGVCWSITSGPTITSSKTIDVLAGGTFSSSITGLSLGVTYYVRAYATNSAGAAYGNELSFTAALAIGDSYQGGKVAYILQPGDPGYSAGQTRGLIAAPSDQSTGAEWGCIGTTITGADGIVIGTGNQNTTDIMAGCSTAGIAAKLCNDLVLDGYSDWYLPSKDELNKLYINKSAIGVFSFFYYWSSTESSSNEALLQNFSTGNQQVGYKDGLNNVRAIRAFPPVPVLPALTTTAISSITSTTATSGGNILSDGGATVTAQGVCWSTSANPVATGNHTSDGGVTGPFTSSITGLSHGVTYYVRAYATNSAGTAYGNERSFTTVPTIGDSYQGGLVAYIFQSGDPGYIAGQTHGLIAATSDQSTSAAWSNGSAITTGATGIAIGTGSANTTTIITSQGNTGSYAAKLCRDYNGGGYIDWYLPSKDELNKLLLNGPIIGGFSPSAYWNSTEADNINAWFQNFNTGFQGNTMKSGPNYVRAVRSF